jgi:hypothetical protein
MIFLICQTDKIIRNEYKKVGRQNCQDALFQEALLNRTTLFTGATPEDPSGFTAERSANQLIFQCC